MVSDLIYDTGNGRFGKLGSLDKIGETENLVIPVERFQYFTGSDH